MTVVLTTNTRKAYGDEAKESIVGVYRVKDPKNIRRFQKAVGVVTNCLSQMRWLHPRKRAEYIRQTLAGQGFTPEPTEEIFISLF